MVQSLGVRLLYLDEIGVLFLELKSSDHGGGNESDRGDGCDLGAIVGVVLQNLIGVRPNLETL